MKAESVDDLISCDQCGELRPSEKTPKIRLPTGHEIGRFCSLICVHKLRTDKTKKGHIE